MPVGRQGNPNTVKQFINHSDWNFVENKGQLVDDNGNSLSDIKYYGRQGGVNLYCKPGMISFVFTRVEKEPEQISEATSQPSGIPLPKGAGGFGREKNQPSRITTSRADLVLLNSNPSAQILASDQQEYYENYYTTGNADSGITNVHTYKTITYKSIYPNIDLVLRAKPNGMKYEFVVYPDGKVSDIQMQWNGLEGIKKLKDNGIEYSLALGKMEESKPVSFQGQNFVESDFLKHSNVIGFKVNRYDKEKVLVIDPILIWGTYLGGDNWDHATGIAKDANNNVFITGNTQSSNSISSTGAFQTSFGGGSIWGDVFIAKFSPNGNRIWSTYFGGIKDELSGGIATDASGNVIIAGETTSLTGLATSGAYLTGEGLGGIYAFIAKFSSSGSRVWSTYYGGYDNDGALAVATDVSGNVFITGTTTATSGIASPGAYQTSLVGTPGYNPQDAYLVKFSPSGQRLWATYFGGGTELGYSVCTDTSGNVFITGFTGSSTRIASSGAWQTDRGAGFIAKFSSSGHLSWSTYYGESINHSSGWLYGTVTDKAGNLYITGTTGADRKSVV